MVLAQAERHAHEGQNGTDEEMALDLLHRLQSSWQKPATVLLRVYITVQLLRLFQAGSNLQQAHEVVQRLPGPLNSCMFEWFWYVSVNRPLYTHSVDRILQRRPHHA